MGIIRRAVVLLERAQECLSGAARQASRLVRAAPDIAAREERRADLQARIDKAVLDVGKQAFRRWKARDGSQDAAIALGCRNIELLNQEYMGVLAELADLKAGAGYVRSESSASGDAAMPPYPSGNWGAIPPAVATGVALPAYQERQEPAAKVCQECLAEVAGSSNYCPFCGMRV